MLIELDCSLTNKISSNLLIRIKPIRMSIYSKITITKDPATNLLSTDPNLGKPLHNLCCMILQEDLHNSSNSNLRIMLISRHSRAQDIESSEY